MPASDRPALRSDRRRFPGAAAYLQALQHPDLCLSDPELATSSVEVNPLGLPRAVSGNFATVARLITPDGSSYAIRCFVRCPDDVGARYRAIGRHLHGLDEPWNVGFDYQDRGIRVGREWYPIVRTPWLTGRPLSSWISDHLWDSDALAELAVRFAGLTENLRSHNVAHGDLQHGNILVEDSGELRLIDYDGMYVPELAGAPSGELGHRNYQHPARTAADWGPHLDHFATWVIYTSLLSLSVDPLLWGRLDAGDDCLLFRWHDFADPARSAAFACLESRADSMLGELASALRDFVSLPVDGLPALPDVDDLLPSAVGRGRAGGPHPPGECATDLAASQIRVAELTARRAEAEADDGRLPALRRQQRELMAAEEAELAQADRDLAAGLASITASGRELHRAEQAERAAALVAEREDGVRRGLRAHSISDLRPAGVTEAMQASLAWIGVRTAADFTHVDTNDARGGSSVLLTDGRRARLDSLGAGPGQAMGDWRRRLEARLAAQFEHLSPQREAAITAHFEPQRRALASAADGLRAESARRRQDIRDRHATRRRSLADAVVAEQRRLAANLHQLDTELADARRALAEASWRSGLAG